MNTNKFLIGSLLGFVAFFMMGYLTYVVIFQSALESACPGMSVVMRPEADMMSIVLGNLAVGVLLAYIYENLAGIRTLMAGLTNGVIIGGLMAFSYDAMMLATTTIYTWNGVFLDTLIYMINCGVSGAVIAWWLGYNRH